MEGSDAGLRGFRAKHASVSLASDESNMVSFVTRSDVSHTTGETTGRGVRGFRRIARVAAIARLRQSRDQRARRPRSVEACCMPHQAILRVVTLYACEPGAANMSPGGEDGVEQRSRFLRCSGRSLANLRCDHP